MNAARISARRRRVPLSRQCARTASARRRPGGLTLLEVILATAILGLSMVALAELVRIGTRSSREARELTVAQLLCEAKLAEVALGFVPAQAASQQPCETDPNWVYTIDVQPGNESGLLLVMVQVSEAQPISPRPLQFTLTRWMVDPSLDQATMSGSTTSSTGSSTSNSSSNASTGSSGTGTSGSGSSSSGTSGS